MMSPFFVQQQAVPEAGTADTSAQPFDLTGLLVPAAPVTAEAGLPLGDIAQAIQQTIVPASTDESAETPDAAAMFALLIGGQVATVQSATDIAAQADEVAQAEQAVESLGQSQASAAGAVPVEPGQTAEAAGASLTTPIPASGSQAAVASSDAAAAELSTERAAAADLNASALDEQPKAQASDKASLAAGNPYAFVSGDDLPGTDEAIQPAVVREPAAQAAEAARLAGREIATEVPMEAPEVGPATAAAVIAAEPNARQAEAPANEASPRELPQTADVASAAQSRIPVMDAMPTVEASPRELPQTADVVSAAQPRTPVADPMPTNEASGREEMHVAAQPTAQSQSPEVQAGVQTAYDKLMENAARSAERETEARPVESRAVEAKSFPMSEAIKVLEQVMATRTTSAGASATDIQKLQDTVLNQVVARAQMTFGKGNTEMRIRLRPPELGDLTIRVMVENGAVTAKLSASSSQVKNILESSLPQLRNSLEERGIKVEAFTVDVSADGNASDAGSGHARLLHREGDASGGRQAFSYGFREEAQKGDPAARPAAGTLSAVDILI